jgi:hypothetical protein
MSTPELYFDPDGKPITVQQWADLRDELGRKMIVARDAITDRAAPSWTIFVTTAWWGIAPVPGEEPPRVFRTEAFRVGHVGRPHPVDLASGGHAWSTTAAAKAGHAEVVELLSGSLSEPVVTATSLPPAAFAGHPCPRCGKHELREIARPEKRIFVKTLGTHSLSGAMMKVGGTEAWVNWPYALCSACGFEKAGKIE